MSTPDFELCQHFCDKYGTDGIHVSLTRNLFWICRKTFFAENYNFGLKKFLGSTKKGFLLTPNLPGTLPEPG
jgi:hypothetical protein